MLSISLSVSSNPPTALSLPSVCHDVVCCRVRRGNEGPPGEQVSTVTAVFIGTQVSSGAPGRQDNTVSPALPSLATTKHTATQMDLTHSQADIRPFHSLIKSS